MLNLTANQVKRIILWLQMKHELVSPIRQAGPINEESGVDVIFMPVDETCGIKLYRNYSSQASAERSYEMNCKLAELGLAPKAWGFSQVRLYGEEFSYFFTERVKILYNDYIWKALKDNTPEGRIRMWDYPDSEPEAHRVNEKCDKLIALAEARLLKHGFDVWDAHCGNFGILRGHCVLIDMGCLF